MPVTITKEIQNQACGLSKTHLVALPNGHNINKDTFASFNRMQFAAKQAGFDLQIVSCHRALDRQLAIWNAKFCGARNVLDINNQAVDLTKLTDWQKCEAILLYSALPGTSRHHWGTDFDFYDASAVSNDYNVQLIESEYVNDGPFTGLSEWLKFNAKEFGFYLPYEAYNGGVAAEPWHLSHHASAHFYQELLTETLLTSMLNSMDIEGKSTLLNNVDIILTQYVNNITPHPF